MRQLSVTVSLLLLACGPDEGLDAGADAGARPDAGPVAPDVCEGFEVPARPDTSACGAVDPGAPGTLVACAFGSGHAGAWTIDADGMPAYELAVDQRCDPAGQHWSPRPDPQRDPVHLLGNGRGLVAMAHASGGIEIYSQDRGHKWINRIDTWVDARDPSFPPQLGGGFSYLALGGEVRSTRFEDLPVDEAQTRQRRRFGVGYFETVTTWADLVVTRRVYAPESDQRALVAEVTVENTSGAELELGLVEVWDPNLHEVSVELATSDVAGESLEITSNIERRRRGFVSVFEHDARYDPASATAVLETRASALPDGVRDRLDPSEADYFPDPMALIALDDAPDAVWLRDEELWGAGTGREPGLGDAPPAIERTLALSGAGQPAVLAMRVPVRLAPGASATQRFAFGYVPAGQSVADLGSLSGSRFADTRSAWRDRMIWAAFEGLESAGAVQRELAWSTYYAIANATFDEYQGVRLAGQGGSYKYIHGLDGAIGDLALYADALLLVDPALSRDTLVYSMGFQAHGAHALGGYRYPYATTGVGSFSDVGIYNRRTDAYWLIPSSVARYVAVTRDEALLTRPIPFHPRDAGESGDVIEHITRGLDYAEGPELGYGARGLAAMGTNDYADGILQLSPEETTPSGASSVFNALFIAQGFEVAADVLAPHDPALAARMRAIHEGQRALIETEAWTGSFYRRGFADNGNPLAPDYLFVEPQVLPILAGLVDDTRRDTLLDLVEANFETPLGAMTTVGLGAGGPSSGPDGPQVGGVWPVASAWVTAAWSRRDPARGWSSFIRNTLFTHAALYPELWYGIWSGPDSYNGPDHERAGEADAHIATALTDYPVLNAHVHVGLIRALMGILGIEPTATGLRIDPRVPTEVWSVRFPRLWLEHRADGFEGTVRVSVDGPIELRVTLPTGLRGALVTVTVEGASVPHALDGDTVTFTVDATQTGTSWAIGPT